MFLIANENLRVRAKMANSEESTMNIRKHCTLHDLELLPLVCTDCTVSVCSECLVHEHCRHRLDKASNAACEYRHLLEQALSDENAENLVLFNKKVDKYIVDQQAHGETVLQSIDQYADALVERLREYQKTESDKVRSILHKYEQELSDVKLKVNQCLHYKLVAMAYNQPENTTPLPMLSDLDTVTLLTDFKHLKKLQSEAAKGVQCPFLLNPFTFEAAEIEFGFGKVVEENECSSDFDNCMDEDDAEEMFHDCEGVPYCLEGEQVADNAIDEIVTVSRNIAYIRCKSDLYKIHKVDGQWKRSHIQQDVGQILKSGKGTVYILAVVNNQLLILEVVSDGRIALLCTTGFNSNSDGRIFLDRNFGLNFLYTFYSYQDLNFSFYTYADKERKLQKNLRAYDERLCMKGMHSKYKYTSTSKVTMQQSGATLLLLSNGTIQSTYGRSLSEFTELSTIRDFTLCKVLCSEVILIDGQNKNVQLLDRQGRLKRILLSDTDGLRCPRTVTLDDDGFLWIGNDEGKIYVLKYKALWICDYKMYEHNIPNYHRSSTETHCISIVIHEHNLKIKYASCYMKSDKRRLRAKLCYDYRMLFSLPD